MHTYTNENLKSLFAREIVTSIVVARNRTVEIKMSSHEDTARSFIWQLSFVNSEYQGRTVRLLIKDY